jgi:hypothetical protein
LPSGGLRAERSDPGGRKEQAVLGHTGEQGFDVVGIPRVDKTLKQNSSIMFRQFGHLCCGSTETVADSESRPPTASEIAFLDE